jgi:hypothetical protein
MSSKGNGKAGPALPSLGPKAGPPTIPLDQLYGIMQELEIAHRVMDAIGAPHGTLPERMRWRAQDWLRRVGGASQTRIGIEARATLRAIDNPSLENLGRIDDPK